MADVQLFVNGRVYEGWKSARFTRSIEAMAGGFELSLTERWSERGTPWPIAEEDECTLVVESGATGIAATPVVTGYVTRASLAYGPQEHILTVSGRDKVGEMVDCSAVLDSWELSGVPLSTLARRLADPFGVSVSVQPGAELQAPARKLTVDPGEKAFEVLDRACRMAGLLPVSDGLGGLLLTRAGSARATTELREGVNVLSAAADFDATERYARYVVSGQQPGTDEAYGAQAAAVKAEALDANVRRVARVLLVRPEGSADAAYAKLRAQWEAKVRAARGDTVRVTVQGWRQADGSLWPVNALVRIRSPLIRVDGEMLITEALFSLDEGGTTTQLTLRRPDAFLPEPVVTAAGTARWKELTRGAL